MLFLGLRHEKVYDLKSVRDVDTPVASRVAGNDMALRSVRCYELQLHAMTSPVAVVQERLDALAAATVALSVP